MKHAALALLITAACAAFPPLCIPFAIVFYFLTTHNPKE